MKLNFRRLLAMFLSIVMVAGMLPAAVFAEDGVETTTYVAKVGNTECADAAALISALNAASGKVTVEIYAKITIGGLSLNNANITELSFVGNDTDAEICVDGVSYIDVRYTSYPIKYTNLILSHINAGQNIDGFLPQYFSTYNGGDVTYTSCTFPNGVTACGSTANTTYTFNQCTFNNTTSGLYSLWVYGNSTNVVINGGTFSGVRGIKMYSEGSNDFSTLSVTGATFSNTITEKHAIVLTKGESITLTGNTFENTTGTVQVDDNYASSIEGKTVTIDGKAYTVNSADKKLDEVAPEVTYVAEVNGIKHETLDAAFAAAQAGDTIVLLTDAAPALTSQRAITKAAVIDLGGKTLTLTEDDLYFGTTTFKNGTIVVDPSVYASTAVFWLFENQTLIFDDVEIIATDVTGTYLIGINGGTGSEVQLVNGSKITIDNTNQAGLTAVICDNGTGNNVVISDSTINVASIEGRLYLGGTNGKITVKDSIVTANGVKEGFYLRAGQTLAIEGTSDVEVTLNDTNGRYGINVTDETATYTKADTATVSATVYTPTPVEIYVAQTLDKDGNVIGSYADFESALAAAVADATVARIVILNNIEITEVKNTEYYDIKNSLTIGATNGAEYTVTINVTGDKIALRVMDGATLTIEENVALEGMDVVANGFGNAGEDMIIDGTLKALSLKQWTSNGTITITKTGSVWLGYGDGQLDLAFGNGTVTVIGDGYKTNPQFKAGYSGTRGDGNTLNLTDTYFEGGAWFTVNGSNGTFNVDNSILKVSGGDGAGSLTVASTGNKINLTNGSKLVVANITLGEGNSLKLDSTSAVNATTITGAGTIVVDVTGMKAGDTVEAVIGNLSGFTGEIEVTGVGGLNAEIVDGKIVLVEAGGLSGSGTAEDPFLINNLEELLRFQAKVDEQAADGSTQFAGKYFKLTDDINLAGINWNPIGSMSGDHGSFKGVFDGDGHTIYNLNVQQPGNGLGLFARTAGNAEIKNLTLNNVTVKSTDNSNYVGGLVGNSYASTKITNVHVTGNIDISGRGYIGGISGHGYVVMDNVSVSGTGTISSTFWCAGGILGYGGEGATNIMNAHVEGITITSAAGGLGAIVGMAEDNNGTQPISGSNLSAKNVEIKTYTGAYGDSYANYALGYLYGGNPTSKLTGTNTVENVTIETSTGETPAIVDAVASIGEAIYFDLQSAVNAAQAGNQIKVLRSVTTDELTIPDGATVVLDLNGKTLNGYIAPCTPASLTISNGSIKNTNPDKSAIEINAGTLTLTDVNIESARHGVRIDGVVKALINGGQYTLTSTSGTRHAVNVSGAAEVTISDGTFVGPKGTTMDSGSAVCVQAGATVSIEGGSYFGGKNNTLAAAGTLTVTGGTFDQDPTAYVATGYKAEENEGIFSVVKSNTIWKVATKAELADAVAKAQAGDTILLTADIDYGTDQLKLEKAITLDLGGKTLTTRATNYGLALKNDGCVVTNGTLNHAGTVAAIKVWNAKAITALEINVTGTSSKGNTIDGIVIQENAAGVDLIQDVTIHSTTGQGVDSGIKTYNCGNATEPVIGSMENVTIDAKSVGLNISAPCGTATNCTIKGGTNGIEIWIKGTYSATLDLYDCEVVGGVFAHDEFSSDPSIVNNGTLKLTADDATTGASEDAITLTIARAEKVDGILKDVMDNAQAKVNDTYYATLAEAVAEIGSGDVVIDLLADATLDITAWQNLPIGGDTTTSITINGNGKTLTFNHLNSDWNNVATNNNAKLILNNMKITNSGYNNGPWNRHDINFACDVELHNVTSDKALAFKAGATLDTVTISDANTSDTYAIWIQPNGQTVTITNSTIDMLDCTDGRGIKIDNQYNEAQEQKVTLNVSNTSFKTEEKAAIMVKSAAGADIKLSNVDISGVVADTVNEVWNDEDSADSLSLITVTGGTVYQEGAEAAGLPGSGTETDPFLIDDINDLKWFRDDVNAGNNYSGKYVKLNADINLAGENWTPIGNDTNRFQGTFDGNDKTISNLVITGNTSDVGFFGVTTNGEIKNLTINNAKVSGYLNVAVVAGTPYTSKYTKINVTGHVEVNGFAYVGGVGGKNAYANWTDITVNVDDTSYVKATSTDANGNAYRTYVGGVVGFNGEGGHTFKNITSNIDVIGDVCDIGGIFGIAHYGNNFENITCTGDVTNTIGIHNDGDDAATDVLETGLIAGVWHNRAGNTVTFTNISATGTIKTPNVQGVTFVNGGLIGNAYSASNNTAENSGSLIIDGKEAWLVVPPKGNVPYAYTSATTIWGETWTNSKVSYVIKVVDANGNVMGTSTLNPALYTFTGNTNVTWHITLPGITDNDEWWIQEWTTAPSLTNAPAKVELWADGVKVNEGNIQFNEPDNLNTIYAAVAGADGKILSYYTSVSAAGAVATSGQTVQLLRDTTETVELAAGVTLDKNGFTADGVTVATPIYVAQIGETTYTSLQAAIDAAAQTGDTITLIWAEGDAPIAMNGAVYGKTVTITGTATVDWSKGNLFVGRGGEGNGTVIFDNAKLTSASNSSSYGIHVSGREKDTDNKYDGTLIIKNSTIELDYLINKGTMTLDNSTLTVKNGFSVGGRPASETESGEDATATLNLTNGSKVIVNNHNGMGLGYEAIGVMNVNTGSTFECTQSFLVTGKGTMNVNGGNVKIDGTLTNNGTVAVTGETTLNINTLTGSTIDLMEGAIVKNSTVGGKATVLGTTIFRGENTFTMIDDYGPAYSPEGQTANWMVENGASLTLTEKARYGLGYGDKVVINGNLTDALTARETLTDDKIVVSMHGLVAMSSWNVENSFEVNNAYVVIGSNNSFGNKPGNYGGTYKFAFDNVVLDSSRITFYEAGSTTEFTFNKSDVKVGTFMIRDADSVFTLTDTKLVSTTTSNGNDEGNYLAGTLVLNNSSLSYEAPLVMESGSLTLGAGSRLIAPSITGNGKIIIDATGMTAGKVATITTDASAFTGTIEVINNELTAEIDGNGDIVLVAKEAELFDIPLTNIRMGTNLSLMFYVRISDIGNDTDGVVAVLNTFYTDDRGTVTTKIPYSTDTWTTTTVQGVRYYVIELTGLAAKEMSDNVTMHVERDGVAISKTKTTSLKLYCENALRKTTNTKFKPALVDMLNYGAAAQMHFKYNTTKLANAGLTDAERALATASLTLEQTRTVVSGNEFYYASNARFVSDITIMFYVLPSANGVRSEISFTDHYGNSKTISDDEYDTWTSSAGIQYRIYEFSGLVVADASQMVTFKLYDANGNVIVEVQDSLHAYAKRTAESQSASATMKTLADAYMKFATSAKAYLQKS